MRTTPFILAAILATVLLALATPVGAATRTWLGETALWSNPDNWSPNGVPQNGEFLTFPDDGNPFTVRSMNNDLVNLTLNTITFLGPGYTLDGNVLTFSQGVTDNHSGALNRVRCGIQFADGGGRFNSIGTGQLEVSGTTTLANNQDLIVTPVVTNLTVSGIIQGNGGLVKRGDGALLLRGSANNTYTGPTRVQGGRMHLAKTSGARAISADVTIDADFIGNASLSDDLPGQYPHAISMLITNGGDWLITNGATVTKLFLDSGYVLGSGLLNLECDVVSQGGCQIRCSLNLGNQTRTFLIKASAPSQQLEILGNIIGPLGANSGIIKQGPGLLMLRNQNTYQGPTLVQGGYLYAQHSGALGSTGPGGETRLQGGVLYFDSFIGGPLTFPEPIVVESESAISFSGTNTLTGPLTLNATCGFWGGDNSDVLEIRSSIDGPGGPPSIYGPGGLQVWSGIVRLSGTSPNTYGGGTLVSARGLGWQGVLELAKPDNVVAVPGEVVLHASGAPPGNSVLRQLQNDGVTSVSINREGAWLLNGHGVSLAAPLTFKGAGYVDTQGGVLFLSSNPGTNQLQVLPPVPISYPAGYTAQVFGNVACFAETNHILVENGGALDMPAKLFADSPVVKEGSGTMRLSGGNSNSLTGPLTVNAGRLIVTHPTALGATAAGTFVNDNASLALEGGVTVGFEPLALNSTNVAALTSLGPITNIWRGNVTLQRTASIAVPDPAGVLRFESFFGCCPSFITGPGGLTKAGPGTVVITGTVANNYSGSTTVLEGLLEASRTQGPALSGNVLVSGANAILRTGRSPAITALPTAASMTVQDGALWAMNVANAETLGRLIGDGRLDIGSGAALTVSNSVSCTFSGQVSGSGALNKRGLATLHLTGQSPSYTGPATVFDGTYKVDGYFASSPVTVKLSSILRGSGAVGEVTVENGGVVRVDPRNLGVLGGSMQFNSVNFQSGGVLGAQFFGPHPTGGNDSLYVLNGVTLSTPALSSGFQYPPHEGDVITLIEKIGAGAISGAFSSFPEGVVRTIGDVPVVMSYVGGDGNDATLTVTNLPLRGGGAQVVAGLGGSTLVPDDCSQLRLVVTNRGATTLTGLRGTLRSLTEGVVVTIGESSYPNLAPNARGTNATPFQIRTEPTFPCGSATQFELVLTASNLSPIAIVYALPGASGHGLDFDGRDDQVEIAANTFSSVVNNFTIELWANPAGNRAQSAETNSGVSGFSVPLRQLQRFAVFPDRGNLAYGVTHVSAGLSIGRNGISTYEHGTNPALASVHLPSRLVYSNAVSGWTHVALVYASRAPRLYVNGALVRSGAASLFPSVHPSGSLGGSPQADYGNFEGQLDEVRIWNAALSQSQIQSNMTRSLTGSEANLITYFRCDEGGGSVLGDSASPSPNPTGTLVDDVAFVLPGVTPFGPECITSGGACESCLVASGRFATNTPTLAGPLDASGSPSLCSPARPCPGVFPLPLVVPFIQHTFANTSGTQACVTAQLRFDCPVAAQSGLHAAAYLGGMDTNAPCLNYLGDTGGDGSAPFSFVVPAGSNVVMLVTRRVTGFGCDNYTLELFGLPCPPPTLHIAKDAAAGKVLLQWSSAYPEYQLQSVNSLEDPSPLPFAPVPGAPRLVNGQFSVTNAVTHPRQFFRLETR